MSAPAPSTDAAVPVGRRERRVAETRQAIAAAARELFEERGYSDTTIDQIAERADVATRTLFRYYPSKEALLFASFDEWREALIEALDARPAEEPPLCSVAHALAAVAGLAEQLRPQIDRAMRLAEEHEAVATYQRGVLKAESAAAVARFIADRLRVSVADDPRPEAWAAMMLAAFGTAMKSCSAPSSQHPGKTVEALAALMTDTAGALSAAAASISS